MKSLAASSSNHSQNINVKLESSYSPPAPDNTSSSEIASNEDVLDSRSGIDGTNKNGKCSETLNSLQLIKDLDLFLVTAPVNWHENQVIRRYFLNEEEGFVSCVYWKNLYFITGTDIVRCIAYKMGHIGRQIIDRKKFEEGIFSDLRSLKCGTHAILENSRSSFLKFLHRNQCLRTQKKQKVFFWFSVPHNKLFADVLERDLKRELANQPTATKPICDIYSKFSYDQSLPILEQLSTHFTKELGVDVSGFLLKENISLQQDNEPSVEDSAFGVEDSNSAHIPKDSAADNIDSNNAFSDEFPLDFLSATNSLADDDYTTSASYEHSNIRHFGNVLDTDGIENKTGKSLRSNNSHFYQQQQNTHSNTTFSESLDGLVLNSFNQPLFSASFATQPNPSTQPMYIVSGLPSAIDPKNTFGATLNDGKDLSMQVPQYVPIQNNSVLLHNDQCMGDQSLLSNDLNSQIPPYMFQILRQQSPFVPSNSNAFVSLPSSNLIPITMPMASAVIKRSADEVFNTCKNVSTDKHDLDYNSSEGSTASVSFVERSENAGLNEQSDSNKHSPQDYMMVSMPSFLNSSNRMNFGLVNGQLFTPGTVGIDYNIDNPVLSAGVGISPVIGFNNGLISAIQYQHSTSNRHFSENDTDEHDDEITEKKLKSILHNDNKSKITKGQPKSRLLNPSLQHLQLDSLFDENDTSLEENDTLKTEAAVKPL